MNQKSYVFRGVLYFLVAVLPIVGAGIAAGIKPVLIAINATAAGLTALRAFIDRSPADYHEANDAVKVAADASDAKG